MIYLKIISNKFDKYTNYKKKKNKNQKLIF